MNEERGAWYLLTAIIMGIGLGLLYSWIISPAEYINIPPSSLRDDYKERYRSAIAAAYEATGNIQRAEARLNLLGDENPSLALVIQAQRYLADGDDFEVAQALANLASAFGEAPTPFSTPTENIIGITPTPSPEILVSPSLTPSQTPSDTPTIQETDELTSTEIVTPTLESTAGPSPTPTSSWTPGPSPTATPTFTPTPTRTPTATLAPPFKLLNQVNVCDPIIGEPQLQVFLSNAAGIGVPGIEIVVNWDGGEDHFFTGLKPDIDSGYADFVMVPEVFYTLQAGFGGQLISGITPPSCTDEDGNQYWGSLRFVFSHP